jgi:hypothetical protein
MIIVAGHWEIGYYAPIMESYHWAFPLRDFGVKEWLMCPVSGVKNPDPQVNLKEYPDYASMFEDYPDIPRVFLEPRTKHYNPDTIWLHDFKHPEDVIYIFGSAHYNPSIKYKRDQDAVVSIKSMIDSGVPWSNQCMMVVLYDRMIKSWQ